MMGGHHAATGAAAWVAISTQIEVPMGIIAEKAAFIPETLPIGFGLMDVSPIGVITGALVCAGAALLPDADHHNATIAHSLPPLSNAMCAGIGAVSGGHRHGTHSIIGIAVFMAVAWAAGLIQMDTEWFGTIYPGAGVLAVLLVAFAAHALKILPKNLRKIPWVVGIVFGSMVALFAPQEQYWFIIAMGVGTAIHIVGDMLTTGGCNLLWPLTIKPPKALHKMPVVKDVWKPNGYLAFPILGNAGSVREWIFCIPVAAYAIIGIYATLGILATDGAASLVEMVSSKF